MQHEKIIEQTNVCSILNAVYENEAIVCEAYSEFDKDIISFPKLDNLEKYIETELSNGNKSMQVVIYYPETKGFIQKRKINLKPEKCDGATLRYTMEGWGLIQLQINYIEPQAVRCRIAVNTEKRAAAWSETIPELKSPALWDWKLVEKHARRLIRILKACA